MTIRAGGESTCAPHQPGRPVRTACLRRHPLGDGCRTAPTRTHARTRGARSGASCPSPHRRVARAPSDPARTCHRAIAPARRRSRCDPAPAREAGHQEPASLRRSGAMRSAQIGTRSGIKNRCLHRQRSVVRLPSASADSGRFRMTNRRSRRRGARPQAVLAPIDELEQKKPHPAVVAGAPLDDEEGADCCPRPRLLSCPDQGAALLHSQQAVSG